MGWLTPKYPTSDTPGASAAPAPPRRAPRRRAASTTSGPTGMTIDQMRGLAMHQGGRVKAGKYMLIRVESRGLAGGTDYSHQRYVKQSDGSWVAG